MWLSSFSHLWFRSLRLMAPEAQAFSRGSSHQSLRTGLVLSAGTALAIIVASSGGSGSSTPTSAPASAAPSSSTTGTATAVTIAPETSTPGDIPDTTAYVPYVTTVSGYTFSYPEGWAQTTQGTSVSFTDKYNGASATVAAATAPPNVPDVPATEVPRLQSSEPAFVLISTSPVTLPAGPGVLIIYRRNSSADPVTGRSVRQEVHRYLTFGANRVVVHDLFGVVVADNTEPYSRMSQSLHIP